MPGPRSDRMAGESPADLSTLVASVRSGSAEALGALYARMGTDLLRVATQIVASRADAEDVLHDVFLGLPEALRHYQEQGSLVGWLRRVTARTALAKLRSARRRGEVTLPEHLPDAVPGIPEPSVQCAIAA